MVAKLRFAESRKVKVQLADQMPHVAYAPGRRQRLPLGAFDIEFDEIDRHLDSRKQLVKFFEAWGPKDELTVAGRKRLSSILFS